METAIDRVKTALIRVRASRDDDDYIVELSVKDAPGDAFARVAEALMPADLRTADAPEAVRGTDLLASIPQFLLDHTMSGDFIPVGRHLTDLLLTGDVGTRWDQQRTQTNGRMRTLLRIEPLPLALLPWELMSREESPLFIQSGMPFARVGELEEDDRQDLVPLRLLVVEGTRDDDLGTTVEARGIRAALLRFCGRMEAKFLCEPSLEGLIDAFEELEPHIFHFIGHGEHVPGTNDPALQMRGWQLTRPHILDALTPTPRVAVINACRSGNVDDVRALTDAFLSKDAAAVIGMRGDIRGRAAGRFGYELYRALADGQALDESVASARREVYRSVGITQKQRDWVLPSLTLRVDPTQALPMRCGIRSADVKMVQETLFAHIGPFVDRTEERLKLAGALDPDKGDPKRLLLVTGDHQVGKTKLVHWIRNRCALRGLRVRYVDFGGPTTSDFVQALELIRDAKDDVPSLAIAPEAFARFNWDLGFLAAGQRPEEPQARLPQTPPTPAPERKFGEGMVELAFTSFRAALLAATVDQPLVLILDHINGLLEADFKQRLYPLLLKEVQTSNLPQVRAVVVLSSEQKRNYWPAEESNVGFEVPVDLIAAGEFKSCAEELVLAMGKEFEDWHEKLIDLLKQKFTSHWKPFELSELRGLVAR